MTESATATMEVTYNEFAEKFAAILEQLNFSHLDTTPDAVEQWERKLSTGSTQVDIDYISGEVSIRKYDKNDRLKHWENKSVMLRMFSSMETAARYAI